MACSGASKYTMFDAGYKLSRYFRKLGHTTDYLGRYVLDKQGLEILRLVQRPNRTDENYIGGRASLNLHVRFYNALGADY